MVSTVDFTRIVWRLEKWLLLRNTKILKLWGIFCSYAIAVVFTDVSQLRVYSSNYVLGYVRGVEKWSSRFIVKYKAKITAKTGTSNGLSDVGSGEGNDNDGIISRNSKQEPRANSL